MKATKLCVSYISKSEIWCLQILVKVFFVIIFLMPISGCSFADCAWIYKLEGIALDDKHQKVVAVSVSTLEPKRFEQEPYLSSRIVKTDSNGFFNVKYTGSGITWGYQELFGVIKLPPTGHPEPPLLDNVKLYIQKPGEEWKSIEIQCASLKQEYVEPGIKKVDLGGIVVP